MTESDAWMQEIAAIVRQKNQAKQDAATLKRDREQHLVEEYEKARQLVKGQPTAAFEQFASYLNSEGEIAKLRHDTEDREGPWVGIDISDADGKFLDVRLQARVGGVAPRWFWIHAYGDRNNRNAQEEEIASDPDGPSTQYVLETLAGHYMKASAKHR